MTGEWRNHIHHYQSDSDFYLAASANGLRPVITEMNVIGSQCAEKGPPVIGQSTADLFNSDFAAYATFGHLACHNAYLFDATDPCYATPMAYGCHAQSGPLDPAQQQASLALVREKLQTIDECQSEEGGVTAMGGVNMSGTTLSASATHPNDMSSQHFPCANGDVMEHCNCDDKPEQENGANVNRDKDNNKDGAETQVVCNEPDVINTENNFCEA